MTAGFGDKFASGRKGKKPPNKFQYERTLTPLSEEYSEEEDIKAITGTKKKDPNQNLFINLAEEQTKQENTKLGMNSTNS